MHKVFCDLHYRALAPVGAAQGSCFNPLPFGHPPKGGIGAIPTTILNS